MTVEPKPTGGGQDHLPTALIATSVIITTGYVVGTIFLGLSDSRIFHKVYWPTLVGFCTIPFHLITVGTMLEYTVSKPCGIALQRFGEWTYEKGKEKAKKAYDAAAERIEAATNANL